MKKSIVSKTTKKMTGAKILAGPKNAGGNMSVNLGGKGKKAV